MQLAPISTFPTRFKLRAVDVTPGVAIAVGIALVATVIGSFVPLVGSALPAIIIGVAIALVRKPAGRAAPGIAYSSKFLLQLAVVLLGAQLSLMSIFEVGLESLPVMMSSLVVCLLGAWLIGRLLRVSQRERTLIGVGTGIWLGQGEGHDQLAAGHARQVLGLLLRRAVH